MKKSIKYTIITGAIISVFSLGAFAGATSNLATEMFSLAMNKLGDTGNKKIDELIESMGGDLSEKIREKAKSRIGEKEAYVEQELQNYYDSKLDNLTNTQEYRDAEAEIDRAAESVIQNGKNYIDQQFK